MAVRFAVVMAIWVLGRAASNNCSLYAYNASESTVYNVSCNQVCAKWMINITEYSSTLAGRCSILPCVVNAASWSPDVINVTTALEWTVSLNRSQASFTVNGPALLEISCFSDWKQLIPVGNAMINKTLLPVPTTTINVLLESAILSTDSTLTVMNNVSTISSLYTISDSTQLLSETPSSSLPFFLATPLMTPAPIRPASRTIDESDEVVLSPASETILPNNNNGVEFLCILKTSDPFVVINDSLTYPTDRYLIQYVTVSAVLAGQQQWNITVIVKPTNNNSTKVQCLSTDGSVTTPAYLIIAGAPLSPYPQLLVPFDVSAVQISWAKPFTWAVADIMSYTIRVFRTDDYTWNKMSILVYSSPNNNFFDCEVQNYTCTQELNRTSPNPQEYYITISGIVPKRSCYTLQFYVSASNSVAESDTMLADKDVIVGPLTDLTPQFVVTPLFRLNGTAVLVTEIQTPILCAGQSVRYSISVIGSDNFTIDVQNLTKTYPFCNVTTVTNVVSGKLYKVTVIVNTFGESTNWSSDEIEAPLKLSSIRPTSSTSSFASGNAQGCQVQNTIIGVVSGVMGLLMITTCTISAILICKIRARRKKVLVPVRTRVERSNPLYEDSMSHPYEQVNMKMRPLPPEPASPNEDRYFMSPNDRAPHDISLPQGQKTEAELDLSPADLKAGAMVL